MLLSLLREPSVPQFVEGALVLLSVGSETFPQAPILPHPSRGGGSNCLTRWSQLFDKVVPIVRQSGSNCPTEFGFSGNWNHFVGQIGPL